MESIGEFLQKYLHITPPLKTIRDTVVRAIREESGIAVDPESVRRSHETLFLDVPPLIKGEILIHRSAILKTLRDVSVSVKEIR